MTGHRTGAVTAFSQRDPRWANDRLGDSTYTMATAGCLVTAAASMLVDFGVETDPGRLNQWLRENNGYKDGCLFRFYALARLGADLVQLIRPPAAPLTGYVLDAVDDDDHAAIAELPRDAANTHWVRICAGIIDSGFTWYIMDPWQPPGTELTTVRRAYPRAKLRSLAAYTRSAGRCKAEAACPGRALPRGACRDAGLLQGLPEVSPTLAQQVLRTPPRTIRREPTINWEAIAAARRALRGENRGDR